jgi:hypothetical protein
MATIALATTKKSPSEKGNSQSRYQICAGLAANTSAATTYYTVPGDGVITAAVVTGSVTSDATKTYTYVITNVTASKTVTAASQVYDADPVLTAGTPASLTLSTTAADVAVTKGDVISIAFTGGTGSGTTSVIVDVEIVA